MKLLFAYVSPQKDFSDEGKISIKIQIDNSLELGWKKEDIILATNFPYEYKGVKSIIVKDEHYCPFRPTATKINVIIELFERNLIEDDLYWFHDLDMYQVLPITAEEIGLEEDMGVTDYGKLDKWNTGTIFFKKSARDIFEKMKEIVYLRKSIEERALDILTGLYTKTYDGRDFSYPDSDSIKKRVKRLNIAYNFCCIKDQPYDPKLFEATGDKYLLMCAKKCSDPIKVLHFHLSEMPQLPERLKKYFV